MRIGILGGTFNPIHQGHLYMAEEAKRTLALNHVIFMPNYIPPHKDHTDISADHRVEMLRLALSDFPEYSISTYEIEKEGISYTFETVKELHRRHPSDTFFFIIGEDSYVNFWTWKNPEEILQYVEIAVLERKGYDTEASRMTDELFAQNHKKAYRIDSQIVDVSSTEIRKKINEGQDISGLIPEKVVSYIYEHKLYQNTPWTYEQLDAYVKEHVKPSRYKHIQGVIIAAQHLAKIYGEDKDKITLAALCHDILKDHDDEFLLDLIKLYGETPEDDGRSPQILHAQAGALFLEHKCFIKDEDLLNAVRYHTTGRPAMSLTEKIIFMADYIEEGRDFPGVDSLRALAPKNLDEAIYTALSNTIKHLESMHKHITPSSRSTMEYYKRKMQEGIRHE